MNYLRTLWKLAYQRNGILSWNELFFLSVKAVMGLSKILIIVQNLSC